MSLKELCSVLRSWITVISASLKSSKTSPLSTSKFQLASKGVLALANDRNSREVFGLLDKPDLSPNLSIQGWLRDNPILYLSLLSDENKTSPEAMSLIRYHNLPEKQLWEAIRVSPRSSSKCNTWGF